MDDQYWNTAPWKLSETLGHFYKWGDEMALSKIVYAGLKIVYIIMTRMSSKERVLFVNCYYTWQASGFHTPKELKEEGDCE
jgi:hypothetical protein